MEKSTGSGKESTSLVKMKEQAPQKSVYFNDLPTKDQLRFLKTMLGDREGRFRHPLDEMFGDGIPYYTFQMLIASAVLYVYDYLAPAQGIERLRLILIQVFTLISFAFALNIVANVFDIQVHSRRRNEVRERIAKLKAMI